MKPFFDSFPKISVAFEDICPNADSPEHIRRRAVYVDFIRSLEPVPTKILTRYRKLAAIGELYAHSFTDLDEWFLELQFNQAGKPDRVAAFEYLNQIAMNIAQVLFVDNCIKEGLGRLLDEQAYSSLVKRLAAYIAENARQDPGLDAAFFYSRLLILQTAFDKLFVPDEEIVDYNPETGDFRIHESYDRLTAYLELSNKKVITACDREKELCYNLTTGWGKGIDRETWDTLNRNYYDGGDNHFFSKYYHTTLEKMLPQFAYGRVRLAESLLLDHKDEAQLQILEIGAGSGSFTLDLQMAVKRLGVQTEISYLGLEPSILKDHFKANAAQKVGGESIPENWRIMGGALEDVTAEPSAYIAGDRKTVIVLSYCAHHCYRPSLEAFLESESVKNLTDAIYILDGTNEHGWTKVYYMWIDVQSPENFDNLHLEGIWDAELAWQEPCKPICGYAATNAWCQLRRLT